MRQARSAWRAAAALLIGLWVAPLVFAKDEPTFHTNKFENPIRNLNYFEDSDVILFQDVEAGKIYRSPDAGATWEGVKDIPDGEAARLIMHEFDQNRAYVLTESATHWRTEDRGKTWAKFNSGALPSAFQFELMMFHASDPDRIIFNGMDCQSIFCDDVTMYTIDGFKSEAKVLRGNTGGCWWAASSKLFKTGEDDLDKQRILCIARDSFSPFKQDQRLLISDNYFKPKDGKEGPLQEFEPNLDGTRGVQGVVNIAVVRKYILVATTSMNTDEMALFVTDDTKKWHRAVFPTDHKLNQEAYTVLESTDYSIQVDVMDTHPSNPMGVMFTSNSNGTYFTRNIEFTNRNKRGHVDFEKISGVQGIFLVNTVENGKDVLAKHREKKTIASEISFDDGRTFAEIKTAEGERIHVHSVTELDNVGRVFSSPAPGLVMANGNVGKHLTAFKDSSLFISDNAGLTWIQGPKGPHKYEFGDQGSILVAVKDAESVDEITYSLDHGKTWQASKLPDGLKVKPFILTTTQDSTSLKFMFIGVADKTYHAIGIDFEGLHEATCKDSDLEDWWARVDKDGNPTCLMGHKQKYHRRKKDAKCFLKQEFKDPVPETENCECTDEDFECDFNFKREGAECKNVGPIAVPEGACKDAQPEDTFKGSNGWRLIPGNTCKRKDGTQKDEPVELKCSESEKPGKPPMSGKIENTLSKFPGKYNDFDKYYLERGDSSSADDETIIVRPYDAKTGEGGQVYVTHDHGKEWKTPDVFKDVNIWAIIPHPYFKEVVFFVTRTNKESQKVIYTIDKGQHYHEFTAPYKAAFKLEKAPLAFHPDKKDWLIWVGEKCESNNLCYLEASYSKDRGDNWRTLRRYVNRCEFIGSSAYKFRKTEEILCLAKTREDNDDNNPYQLLSSSDWFDTPEVRQDKVKEFATMAEFIVVAATGEKDSLRAMASLDGVNYADAHFPYNFKVPHQHAYTVLDSSTHAVNLFVVTEGKENHRYGSIIKSNSNGTSYVMSIEGVNCNNDYYVDFEKMLGLEGVIMVNTVANKDNLDGKKQLRSRISHNDGAEWAYLPPPAKDVEGKSYSCSSSKGDDNCALHIHGYTEREDHRKTYSSEGAVGLMFAIGHVGSHLGEFKDADTFMTADAGISWKNVKKGAWTWQFGDMGSTIVLVQRHKKTKTVSYSTDEGTTWTDHEFHESEVEVLDLTTLRSGSTRKFVVWCKSDSEVFSVTIDFSGLTDQACVQDKDDPTSSKSDYYLWSPSHPLMPDNRCLFGHESQYLRKKSDRKCYNGYKLQHLYNMRNCTCTRRDFECDFNFELDNVNSCSLVTGLQPQSKEDYCSKNSEASTFYPPTGYRRIPLTTCQGGQEFDKQNEPQPCKGHERDFEREHSGPGGVAIFFAVVIPIAAAAAIGWWVYNNWNSKFGSIRLGENGSAGGGFNIDSDSPFVKYPVIALSATFAVIGAVPLIASALWRTASTAAERWGFGTAGGGRGGWTALGGGGSRRYTTRDSFARGRGTDAYDIVDEDEGMLGDDSDEEV